jgi:hypothetical protein
MNLYKNKYLLILYSYLLFLGIIQLLYLSYYTGSQAYYLRETITITECLKDFQWFGNEGVGLHGFIWKLPLSLVFIITGPSVIIAGIYKLIIGLLTIHIFYKLSILLFKSEKWSALATFFFISSYLFLRQLTLYDPDSFLVLFLLAFIYSIFLNNKYIIAILLLLILDSKEYAFFIVYLSMMIYIMLFDNAVISNSFLSNILFKIKKIIIISIPSFLFIFLMFFTSIIPINSFLTNFLMLKENKKNTYTIQLPVKPSTNIRSMNRASQIKDDELNELIKHAKNKDDEEEFNFNHYIKASIKTVFSSFPIAKDIYPYFIKSLGDKIFTIFTFPKMFQVFAFFGILFIILNKKSIFKGWYFLIIYFLIFSSAFVLIGKMTRYYFPILPIAILFVIYFFINSKKYLKLFLFSILISLFFTYLGFIYESLILKEQLIIFIILFLILGLLLYPKFKIKYSDNVFFFFIIVFGLFTSMMQMYGNYKYDQMKMTLKYGYVMEMDRISEFIPDDQKIILLSQYGYHLVNFYERNRIEKPEWKWKLPSYIPKKQLLKTNETLIYPYSMIKNIVNDSKKLKKFIVDNKINYLYYIDFEFHKNSKYEKLINSLNNQCIIELKEKHILKSKILSIYEL